MKCNWGKVLIALSVWLGLLNSVVSFEPITSTVLAVGTVFGAVVYQLRCQVTECCDDNWTQPNITGRDGDYICTVSFDISRS